MESAEEVHPVRFNDPQMEQLRIYAEELGKLHSLLKTHSEGYTTCLGARCLLLRDTNKLQAHLTETTWDFRR